MLFKLQNTKDINFENSTLMYYNTKGMRNVLENMLLKARESKH